MKIRITDKGFAGLTGPFGFVEFVDGVSVHEVSPAEAARLASILSIEEVDTGINPSITQTMVDIHAKNTEELGLRPDRLTKVVPGEVAENQPEVVDQAPASKEAPGVDDRSGLTYDYTLEDLGALADKEGIAGLRTFAEAYNVNDRSVAGLVQKLMALKAEFVKPAQVEPVVVEPVVEVVEEPVIVDVVDPVLVNEIAELNAALGDVEDQE